MECAICYGDDARCTLTCGHAFCHGCVKNWYQKGTGEGCPMCRAPLYFRGFHKKRDEWAAVAEESKQDEVLTTAFDEALNQLDHLLGAKGVSKNFKRNAAHWIMEDMLDLEKTHKVLKAEGCDAEEMEYLIFDEQIYVSDRSLRSKNQGREKPRRLPEPAPAKRHNGRESSQRGRGQLFRR